jgi:hypothetical protein
MDNHIAVIHDNPAVAGYALLLSPLFMIGANVLDGGFGERVYHAVARAGADDEIVSKGYDVFQIYEDYVFPFFIFKGVYNFAGKF